MPAISILSLIGRGFMVCDNLIITFSCLKATEGSSLCFTYGWGSIRDGVLLFQYSFLTGVLLTFSWGGVVIESGAQIEPIRYFIRLSTQ